MKQPYLFLPKNYHAVLLALGVLFFPSENMAQNQMQLVSHLDYVSLASNIWGYTAPDGTEYALVGLRSGVSVVSLADPAQPQEIQYIPADQSNWRELKTFGPFAYVTTETEGPTDGLLVIDLSNVPASVTWNYWKPVLPGLPDTLSTCHTVSVDEAGYLYLNGCNLNQGGVIIAEVFSQPGQPQFIGYNEPVYAHDCFARGDTLYVANIYEGHFSIFEVSDKTQPVLLATQQTPADFCHNVWPSPDGSILFTTDERSDASTAAYDISNLDDIRLLDELRPPATIGTGVIPHNAHVRGDFVVLSHYTDGVVVVDASHPDNLVETEFFDTNTDFFNGFHGCWGVYPYFQSGLIIASDIENGLYVLQPAYKKAAYLEGQITDFDTGAPIPGARVQILPEDTNKNFAITDFQGNYKTGVAASGALALSITATGYFGGGGLIFMEPGQVTVGNFQLIPLPAYQFSGKVTDQKDRPIAGAQVLMENADFDYHTTTDEAGRFALPNVLHGEYQLFVGKWGYENLAQAQTIVLDVDYWFKLGEGYQDDFNNDLGWTVESTATDGAWERGIPLATLGGNSIFNPGNDSPYDPGQRAYLTGNQGITVHDDQVNDGATLLRSPPMALRSRYNRPALVFDYWFYDAISSHFATDSLTVLLRNGQQTVVLDFYATDTANVQQWTTPDTFDLASYLPLTDEMQVVFRVADDVGQDNVLEAGIDRFHIFETLPDEHFSVKNELVKMAVYPNPTAGDFYVDYKVERDFSSLNILIFNTLGQTVVEQRLSAPSGTAAFQVEAVPGTYFVALRVDGKLSEGAALLISP